LTEHGNLKSELRAEPFPTGSNPAGNQSATEIVLEETNQERDPEAAAAVLGVSGAGAWPFVGWTGWG
jgi:hypothetical protein